MKEHYRALPASSWTKSVRIVAATIIADVVGTWERTLRPERNALAGRVRMRATPPGSTN